MIMKRGGRGELTIQGFVDNFEIMEGRVIRLYSSLRCGVPLLPLTRLHNGFFVTVLPCDGLIKPSCYLMVPLCNSMTG
jgi:hypothetical protein